MSPDAEKMKNGINPDIYYDLHDLLSYNTLFNFVIGNRGAA